MTAYEWVEFFGWSLVALILSVTVLTVLGFYVTNRYPHQGDPDREKKRYTRPAVVLLLVAVLSFISAVASVAGVIISTIASNS